MGRCRRVLLRSSGLTRWTYSDSDEVWVRSYIQASHVVQNAFVIDQSLWIEALLNSARKEVTSKPNVWSLQQSFCTTRQTKYRKM
jgi:hypothetical protein